MPDRERPAPPTAPARPRRAPPWLDGLLAATERSSSLVAISLMMVIIIGCSLGLTLLFSLGLAAPFGIEVDGRLLAMIGSVGVLVPLTVGLPAVLFSDSLIHKIKGMREGLRNALAEAQLASRAKSEFLANMSHELRTPLNGVLGTAQVLATTRLDPEQEAHLAVIRDSGDLLTRVIDDVLDLARIEAGRIDIHPAPAELGAAMQGTVTLFAARAEAQGTRLELRVVPGTPERAVFDSVRARQCLGNLVSNAVKFTRDGTVTVTLSATATEDGGWLVALQVADTGIGICPDVQAHLFRPFVQACSTTGRVYGGTGLGLAIARKLARAMGGDITLCSAPGKGARFTLTFRAARADDAAPALQPPAATAGGPAAALCGLPVLVVDDSAVNRRVARGLLEAMGAICHEADSGERALRMLAERPVGVVLLDQRMPGMDGPATLRAIRAAGTPGPGCPWWR